MPPHQRGVCLELLQDAERLSSLQRMLQLRARRLCVLLYLAGRSSSGQGRRPGHITRPGNVTRAAHAS